MMPAASPTKGRKSSRLVPETEALQTDKVREKEERESNFPPFIQ